MAKDKLITNEFYVNSSTYYWREDYRSLDRAELEKLVRKTTNAANTRLRRLEKFVKREQGKGLPLELKSIGAYRYAMRETEGRTFVRFKSGVKNMTVKELRAEYKKAIEFLDLPSSTVQGVNTTRMKQWESARESGFEGDYNNFAHRLEQAWSSDLKHYFSSEVIHTALVTGQLDVLTQIMIEIKNEALAEYKTGKRKKRGLSDDEKRTRGVIAITKAKQQGRFRGGH